jgi:lipopolysaccharide transport system ATP-binding protein
MSNLAIRVERLGKLYTIRSPRNRHDTLRDHIIAKLKRSSPDDRDPAGDSRSCDFFWALKDVNFEVKKGEVVGFVGRNGAGKSTLLKILSRITEPTEGRVELHGRIGSLLEVGTGFHSELTGRENIYLNGAILGMKKSEIDRNFDEIVQFSEVERFVDVPVKRYSSGMQVRLAFAVAAYLDPEILILDEVLAVGDNAFQKKCLGKMGEVAKQGRTIFIVSHNMESVEKLCTHAFYLDCGRIVHSGNPREVISTYLATNRRQLGNSFDGCPRTGSGKIRLTSFHMETPDGEMLVRASSGQPLVMVLGFQTDGCKEADRASFGFSIHTKHEFGVLHHYSHFSGAYYSNLPCRGHIRCYIPELPLAPGSYLTMFRVVLNGDEVQGEEADWPRIFLPFDVAGADFFGTGNTNLPTWGPILIKANWSLN